MITGTVASSGSARISSSTSSPFLRGRLRSSSTRSGRGAPAKPASRRRYASACSPSGDRRQPDGLAGLPQRLAGEADVGLVVLDEQHARGGGGHARLRAFRRA